ncbi:MAG: condensation domain-containing protein, partial [Lysobacter sp.]
IVEWLKQEQRTAHQPITVLPRESDRVPASFAQQRLWFVDQLGGGSPQYNMPGAMRVSGTFDDDVAERALARIVARHEPLRTVFVDGEMGLQQWIRAEVDFRLRRIDLQHLSGEGQEAAVADILSRDAAAIFDLSHDLMLRASFLRLAHDAAVFVFNMHHIASDGWSMGILVREFFALYEAIAHARPDPLPRLSVQYADYAQWQRRWLAGNVLERRLAYWETQLAGIPALHTLPLDRPRPAAQTFNGAAHEFTLAPDTLAGLKQLALANQATLFMVLQAAFALLLSRHSGSSDIVIGTPVANRMQKELEPLVGLFVNTLVLRADCSAGQSFSEFLARLRRVNLDAQTNQDVPFEYLIERLKPARNASHSPLFQIMFNMSGTGADAGGTTSLRITPLGGAQATAKFELTLNATEVADGLLLIFEYNRDLFEASTIARLSDHMVVIAGCIVADPDLEIGALTRSGGNMAAARPGADVDLEVGDAVKTALRGRLPEYMVPAAVVCLQALPLSGNGKIDRRRLPDPDWSAGKTFVAPEGEFEIRLARIWADILGAQAVGATDNFFDLGGHSLKATRLVSAISREFAIELPLVQVFQAPFLRAMAKRIEQQCAIDASRAAGDSMPHMTEMEW